mmetsp:Transcript_10271/g.15619  ORF Transcript_10271/g.15619 Transcript_10271/m.15619 type:complete len:256 (+) Transcript_10271:1865-2632(+)
MLDLFEGLGPGALTVVHHGPLAGLRGQLGVEDLEFVEVVTDNVEVGAVRHHRVLVEPASLQVGQLHKNLGNIVRVVDLVAPEADLFNFFAELNLLQVVDLVLVELVQLHWLFAFLCLLHVVLERGLVGGLGIRVSPRQVSLILRFKNVLHALQELLVSLKGLVGVSLLECPSVIDDEDISIFWHVLSSTQVQPSLFLVDDHLAVLPDVVVLELELGESSSVEVLRETHGLQLGAVEFDEGLVLGLFVGQIAHCKK